MTSTNDLFSGFAFVGTILALIPLVWHWRGNNTGTCLYSFWAALTSFSSFVNSRVWNQNVLNVAPVWCDITTRIILAGSVGLPAANLCITRRLQVIATNKRTTLNNRRETMINIGIGIGLPLLEVVLSYIVQGHRFNIYEEIGCWPALVNRAPGYALVWSWPIIIGVVSGLYGILAVKAFVHHRKELGTMLSRSKPDSATFEKGLYVRMAILATVDLVVTIPFATYIFAANRTAPSYGPWVSWADVHYDFSRVGQVPSVIWKADKRTRILLELSRWLDVVSAFVFFALFGTSHEALRNYRVFWEFLKRVAHAVTCGKFEEDEELGVSVIFGSDSKPYSSDPNGVKSKEWMQGASVAYTEVELDSPVSIEPNKYPPSRQSGELFGDVVLDLRREP
ncbi:STE3-domain-containing protein [Artomyces pyxidatus]|uniref:STE3-domain-containing protein n=1 Tax=Artomyces pyxidatus TaxID=48021 RepID=A0ACB8SYQ7_9AGAM|nr:STE3-domain-containing protein [Artomyces pyxidatus]